MAGKPNIRSIRFSDELAEFIDRQSRRSLLSQKILVAGVGFEPTISRVRTW